jgi:alpha-ketoglutaric semialdehyde dehydrogenase
MSTSESPLETERSATRLEGRSIIGFRRAGEDGPTFRALNPATGDTIAPGYFSASAEDVEQSAILAASAAPILERMPGRQIAEFLRTIANNIESLGQELGTRVAAESGLPAARVQAETGRTCGQLRLFANQAEENSWVDARIDCADPNRKPLRKPDVRSMLKPLGPVAIFGASNFPLAFSVAGGDTASAFAAGNPVIVKAHPAHPGTSEMVGQAILEAVTACNLPEGTFSLLYDSGYEVAASLVTRPEIKAVGFTGSRRGGRALMDAIARRPDPIPFYGEMSSVNPFFFLPGVILQNSEDRLAGLCASLTNGSGQFCTKPGLIFIESNSAPLVARRLQETMGKNAAYVMLTPGIGRAYRDAVGQRQNQSGLTTLLAGEQGSQPISQVGAALFRTDVKSFLANPRFAEEIFGPAAVLITYSNPQELLEVARNLEGQLTATVHGTAEDLKVHEDLLRVLETKAGRLIFNGFPTGVEVGHAMVHGGPWPATSDSRSTSVGTRAIARFARPVCYQDFPQTSLPDALKDTNPLGIWRAVDGRLTCAGGKADVSANADGDSGS